MRLLIRVRRHPHAERLQLFIGFGGKLSKRAVVALASQRVDERRVEASEPADPHLARVTANALGSRAPRVELADGVVQNRIKRSIVSSSERRQPRDHPLEMSGKTGSRASKGPAPRPTRPPRPPRRNRHTDRSPPLVEHIKYVGLAELDAHRPPPRAFGVVALEIAVAAAPSKLQRNAARRPAADLFECRADDSNEMAIVLAAQVILE